MSQYSIQHIPHSERPREKLAALGVEALNSIELLAILIGSGTRHSPVMQLAQQIITRFGGLLQVAEASVEELCQIKGLGRTKAIQLKAALGLGAKLAQQTFPPKFKIENPLHMYNLLKEELLIEKREIFMAVLLDVKGFVMSKHIIAIGTLTQVLVHPREVFFPAIRHKAASIILAHNHPSGDPTPSVEDINVTRNLVEAGNLLNMPVRDHIVIGSSHYVSLRQMFSDLFI